MKTLFGAAPKAAEPIAAERAPVHALEAIHTPVTAPDVDWGKVADILDRSASKSWVVQLALRGVSGQDARLREDPRLIDGRTMVAMSAVGGSVFVAYKEDGSATVTVELVPLASEEATHPKREGSPLGSHEPDEHALLESLQQILGPEVAKFDGTWTQD